MKVDNKQGVDHMAQEQYFSPEEWDKIVSFYRRIGIFRMTRYLHASLLVEFPAQRYPDEGLRNTSLRYFPEGATDDPDRWYYKETILFKQLDDHWWLYEDVIPDP